MYLIAIASLSGLATGLIVTPVAHGAARLLTAHLLDRTIRCNGGMKAIARGLCSVLTGAALVASAGSNAFSDGFKVAVLELSPLFLAGSATEVISYYGTRESSLQAQTSAIVGWVAGAFFGLLGSELVHPQFGNAVGALSAYTISSLGPPIDALRRLFL